ncbi:MAG: PEP-CTERM sorting domain-containing protein [Phycisphaerae bacterium]
MNYLRSSLFAVLMASTALGGPIELQIDELNSHADVQLCLTLTSTVCDADTTPLAGSISVSLGYPPGPSDISLHDFTFQFTQDVTLDLDFTGVGAFNSTGRNIEVAYADPGNPLAPVSVIGDAFTFTAVPVDTAGQLEYEATHGICTLFTLAGYSCNGAIDLNMITLNPLDIDGTVVVSGNDVSLTLEMALSAPIDPVNPGLGTFSINGTVLATGVIPEPTTLLLLGIGGAALYHRRRTAPESPCGAFRSPARWI